MSCVLYNDGQSYVLCNVFYFIAAFLSHFLIITIPHFIRQILWENRWIPDKKYFVHPCFQVRRRSCFHFISAFLSHFLIITIPHFIRQILREKRWIPDKKYFVHPCPSPSFQNLCIVRGDGGPRGPQNIFCLVSNVFPEEFVL